MEAHSSTHVSLDVLTVDLRDPAHLRGEEVLEVGLRPVAGDVDGGQEHGQPVLDLVVQGLAEPLALAAHLQHCVQKVYALHIITQW